MPGILPMKMIRVGSAAQSRIAQACDRCRSKKIRCDGIRPCCSQCSNVGFECKTSDKLSRRAFPRGYTESLEDRVRGLEAEVRELKDLLDEKDEKIDMLSRLHSFSSPSRKGSSCLSPVQVKSESESPREEVLHVEIPAPVQAVTTSGGSSTTAALIDGFEQKVLESGRECPSISSKDILAQSSSTHHPSKNGITAVPPRLLSDQYINLFFQEWQPLFPIVHRSTLLRIYDQYLSNPEASVWHNNKSAIAQLFLIFDIAAHSASPAKDSPTTYELQWRKALHSASSSPDVSTLQCHVLAQLCYMLKADRSHLLRHRAVGVGICHQLAMHQGHTYHQLSTLEAETRKRVFWCQYVLDKFTSATTGTPMLLQDSDISTEFPADVDDENITREGFSPALPGEITKVSSALAFFRASQILSKTLETLYPAKASYQLSLTKLHAISDELDQWQEELPDHLRLRFCNDKPATNLISDRSPLLSLTYFYVRGLIHRPLLLHGTGNPVSASTIVLAAAAKHILQILDLLDERSMHYTFPLNKTEILCSMGFSILWQSIGLEDDSKLIKDNQRSLSLLIGMLTKDNQSSAASFQRIGSSFVSLPTRRNPPNHIDLTRVASLTEEASAPLENKQKSTRKQLAAIASRWSSFSKDKLKPHTIDESHRRATVPKTSNPSQHRASSTASLSSTHSLPTIPVSSPSLSSHLQPQPQPRNISPTNINVNLDYFPLGFDSTHSHASSTTMLPPKRSQPTPIASDQTWQHLYSTMDATTPNMYTLMSPSVSMPNVNSYINAGIDFEGWPQDAWASMGIQDLHASMKPHVAGSLVSFSEESLTSGEDGTGRVYSEASNSITRTISNGETTTSNYGDGGGNGGGGMAMPGYKGITIPVDDDFGIDDYDV